MEPQHKIEQLGESYTNKIMEVAYHNFPLVHPKETVNKVITALLVEYASQFQEDNKQILLDFIKWSNAVDEYGNKLDKVDIDNFLNKQD